ncbi:uncharacterized protein LOC111701444 isoform X2 [Eurytemora carolleeae]|uniref:uncharacterized protein LOC111701444 isoform X2 n=1 Tax=Eurytemora carolleeae TaxID=1294199 RepID=UPI000C763550|nr:uncharacterized protein LOC111701444 isoform X2 [Eurytemora carolleeae]|eukprot:XP_023328499.1 uncharacterized protein LOC111701444 isoform X2 [Eurytemora affinis]
MLNESSNCVYVAINQPGCPWIDSEDIVRNSGMWARMLSVGFYPVRTKMFPKGFIISVIPVFNSSECRTLPLKFNTSFVNTMSIKVEKTLNSYSLPIGSAVGVVTAIGVLVLFFVVAVWKANMEPSIEVYDENEAVELNGNSEAGNRRAGNATLKTRGSVESEVGPENAYRKVLVSDMRAILKDRPGHKDSREGSSSSRSTQA